MCFEAPLNRTFQLAITGPSISILRPRIVLQSHLLMGCTSIGAVRLEGTGSVGDHEIGLIGLLLMLLCGLPP